MSGSETDKTVGFFDLSADGRAPSSTNGGDDTGERADLQQRLKTLGDAICADGGSVIKQIGDELMCAFPDSATAVGCSIRLQRELDELILDGAMFMLRIGLHRGAVLEAEGDLFGDTVNVAARMASIATLGQIICTEEVVLSLPDDMRTEAELFDNVQVKGSSRERAIFRMRWAPRAETQSQTQLPGLKEPTAVGALTLHHGDQELRLAAGDDDVRLGRDERCELIVKSEMASRFHAIIAARRGKFVLQDQSTNGTWVRMQGSPVVALRREELSLFGEGIICLGETVGGNGMHLIRFTCY